jgi:hypothetical protein
LVGKELAGIEHLLTVTENPQVLAVSTATVYGKSTECSDPIARPDHRPPSVAVLVFPEREHA